MRVSSILLIEKLIWNKTLYFTTFIYFLIRGIWVWFKVFQILNTD
jgi:hypothetical protein